MSRPEPLRVAVAGTSFAAAVQIPVFQSHPRTRVAAVCSGRIERARAVALEYGIPTAYTDFEEMLERARPHLAVVAAPPHLHGPMVLAALRRRIHVLSEKPFALNLAEARQMQAAAAAAGVVAMVDFEFRYLPARRYLFDLLRQNYVGKIRMVEFLLHFGWRSKAEDVGWSWWSDRDLGGGVLGALGSHAVDGLLGWMGRPRRVLCDLVTFVPERAGKPVTSDDAYAMVIEFASGARATLNMSAAAGVEDARVGIYGTEGQLVLSGYRGLDIAGGKRHARAITAMEVPARYQLPKEPGHFLKAPFRVLADRLIQAIDEGAPSPSPNFADGVASQEVLDAARLSADERRWVEI